MNSLYQQLAGSQVQNNLPQMPGIKNMINMIKFAKNPQLAFNQMIANNPQMKQAMNYVQQNGGDPKAAFLKLANEKGVNPDEILNMLK